MSDLRPISEIIPQALDSLANKWEWRAETLRSAGNLAEADRLMRDVQALRDHVRREFTFDEFAQLAREVQS